MKLTSVNVAQPREVEYQGKKIVSSIWKEPVQGPVEVGETNLAGDRQANAAVHGGIHKAVYAYSYDHYAWWRQRLLRDDLCYGMFGENLTVSGLDEARIGIGEQWQVGTAHFAVTGPRIPCSNLAMKFADSSMPRQFTEAGRPGVYLRVIKTGTIAAGDSVARLAGGDGVWVRELFIAYSRPQAQGAGSVLARALTHPFLDPDLATGIRKRLQALQALNQ